VKIAGTRRIAERYVKALFDVAAGVDALDDVEKDMLSLAQALSESEDFQHFLTNPLLSREAQAEALSALLNKMKAHQVTLQFLQMLAAQKRLGALPAIADLFLRRVAAERGELSGELIAATVLKPKEIAQVAERLSSAYGRKVNLEVRQDPGLLGGVVIKIGSVQLDGSLAGKMARLKRTLQAA
jgi:F-type H+-transporting ATPase subunit delta